MTHPPHHLQNIKSHGGELPIGTVQQRARALQMHWLEFTDEQIATRLMSEAPHGSRQPITASMVAKMRQQAFAEQRAE